MQACGAGDGISFPGAGGNISHPRKACGASSDIPSPGKACVAGGNIPHPGKTCGAGDGIPFPGAGGRFPAIHRPQEGIPHPSPEWGNVASQTILSNLPHHTPPQDNRRRPCVASELQELHHP